MKTSVNCKIAVIGIGCFYPGAKSPLQLWENVLARRQQFRLMPEIRLPNSEYYDPDPSALDKTYLNKAAVLDGYSFNWLDRRIPKKTYESTDIVHWLALDTALQAIADARYSKENLPLETTGVIIGNTLTGEFTRSNQMLLRWPYVKKVLKASLQQKGLAGYFDSIESAMEKTYKSVFAPVNEDTLAGGLANTIAGRVCNYLDIHGGGYTVDGACSSSLLAICTAANYLELGQMDMVIAGGVDISLDTFELIGFAKTGALTRDEMRVYDKQGKGFIPGEGCGMVVLKRLEDAVRDKDQVYGIINGWGISSDGKGGITAPSAAGQARALIRAYSKAGFDTEKLDFIEGHGTGTTVGDKTELEGITRALNYQKEIPQRSCGVTSFKSIVGHTKAAAGVGAFIKTVIAVNRRILPPTAGLKEFNPIFEEFAKSVYPILHGQVKDPGSIVHAGVSAMGFGGINSHVLLQSGDAPSPKFQPSLEERKILASDQSSEVILLTGSSMAELIESVNIAITEALGISYAELADFAAYFNKKAHLSEAYRAAIVATTPFDLDRKLQLLKAELSKGELPTIKSLENDTIVYGRKLETLRIGALYPGQGSQQLNMTYKLVERFNWSRELKEATSNLLRDDSGYSPIDSIYRLTDRAEDKNREKAWKDELKQTNVAQPSIIYASLQWQKYLERLGIEVRCATGHSLGELMSFYVAGFFDEKTLLKLAMFRGKSMAECGSGTMASLVCTKEKALEYLSQVTGYITIANINAPEQTVISGDKESVRAVIKLAEQDHIGAVELPVSAAFHSKLVEDTGKAIKAYSGLNKKLSKKKNFKLISSVNASEVEETVNLNEYFAEQAVNQVNFIDTAKELERHCDILIEIGPGKVLSGLTSSISGKIKAFPVEARAKDDVSFNTMLANLFVYGANLHIDEIYADRFIRDFVPASQKQFIVNPLERPFPEDLTSSEAGFNGNGLALSGLQLDISDTSLQEYMNRRGSFIRDVILADMRNMGNIPTSQVAAGTKSNVIKAAAPAVPSASSEGQDVRKLLYEKIEAATGFPSASYKDTMRLLDDFNLDSIKAGSLLNNLAKTFNLLGKVTTADLANASIGTIVERFNPLIPKNTSVSASTQGVTRESIAKEVFNLVTEKTGFPQEQLKENYSLLNDLNLDSIKAGAFMAQLIKNYSLQGKLEASAYANASLGDIIHKITEMTATSAPAQTSATNVSAKEFILDLVSEKTGFPKEGIKPEFRLLDDLNLDSIKAGGVLASIIKHFNLQGKLEATSFSNSRLSDIIEKVDGLTVLNSSAPKQPAATHESATEWVRGFCVELVEEKLEETVRIGKDLHMTEKLGIIYSETLREAENLLGEALKFSKECRLISAKELQSIENEPFDRLLVFVLEDNGNTQRLEETVRLFAAVAQFTGQKPVELGFIQRGDGCFNRNASAYVEKVFSAVAFAASLHLERPSIKIRVIEADASLNTKFIINQIFTEFETKPAFTAAGIDPGLVRRKMVYELASKNEKPRANFTLASTDVVVVTGGAKGITAACALSFASKYGCKMALIGSSAINDEVSQTLRQFEEKGLAAAYYSCNITDSASLKKTIEKITAELGVITGIIHGAGMNIPRRAEQVSFEEAYREIAPKLLGAFNLAENVESKSLKCFIALTSIIGVTGMQGNSWYAFSNEALDLFLRNYGRKHSIPTVTLAYSVWNQIGMGERMGSTKALAHMGIGSIAPDQGIKEFMRWIENQASDQQVVIAARLDGLDTWKRSSYPASKANRYLEKIIYSEPGVELLAESSLNRKHDLYADDHNYNGSLLFPTVFGLEAMAQAASFVSGIDNFNTLKIENISLLRPIVVPDDGDTRIRIKALVMDTASRQDELRIKASISTEFTNFAIEHFAGEFIFNARLHAPEKKSAVPSQPLAIDPLTDLYSWLLFQGPRFRNISKVFAISEKETIFGTKSLMDDTSGICFSSTKLTPFILGSPVFRDILLQSVQLMLTQKKYLPIRIKEWQIFDIQNQPKGGYVKCSLTSLDSEKGICDVIYTNNAMEPMEYIRGYEVKALEPTSSYPLPTEIATIDAGFEKSLFTSLKEFEPLIDQLPLLAVYKHHECFNLLKQAERREISQAVFKSTILPSEKFDSRSRQNEIVWDSNGKPAISDSDLNISLSHSRSVLIMTVGKSLQGCDIEFVEKRPQLASTDLLKNQFQQLLNRINQLDNNMDMADTRIWCVHEAAIKALGEAPDKIEVLQVQGKGIIMEASNKAGHIQVLTFPVQLFPGNIAIVALTVQMKELKSGKQEQVVSHAGNEMFDKESGKFVSQFLTTFKDCKGFYGKTYFTNFPLWMGHLRELVLSPVAKQMLEDFRTGEYGMVTNASKISIYDEAESLNPITGRIWITPKSDFKNSFIDLNYEWLRTNTDGSVVKLADCNLSTTWVKIEGHGIVKQSPLPAYFLEFLEKYLRKQADSNGISLPKPLVQGSLGELRYESEAKPRPQLLLAQKTYQTGIYDGNSVGNLYYSNYYDWQAKTMEHLFYQLMPELYTGQGRNGEYICLEANVNHLQEAMPFEEIGVDMYLERHYDNGMKLFFEYYSVSGGNRRKLAYGSNILQWARRANENSIPAAEAIPQKIVKAIQSLGAVSVAGTR